MHKQGLFKVKYIDRVRLEHNLIKRPQVITLFTPFTYSTTHTCSRLWPARYTTSQCTHFQLSRQATIRFRTPFLCPTTVLFYVAHSYWLITGWYLEFTNYMWGPGDMFQWSKHKNVSWPPPDKFLLFQAICTWQKGLKA